ncbi:MAG: DNA repair protein RadC [bacterium]|nr:DNA repair protein RadC [bacterium]
MSEFISIKNLAEDDKPREKLLLKGKSSLSNVELLAILLSTGTRKKSAIDLAREILEKSNRNLDELAKLSVNELCKIDGIGPAKAITIVAAIELAGRRQQTIAREKPKITTSKHAYEILRHHLQDLNHEEFWLLCLNRAGQVTAEIRISEGGITSTVADPKKIFKFALEHLATGIIVCHNHPSGNLSPSEQDREITNKIKAAGRTLDINLMDHLIITQKQYFSFADEGLL